MKRILNIVFILLSLSVTIQAQTTETKRVAILETVDREGKVPYGVRLMVRSKLCDFITATPGYEGFDRVDLSSIVGEHEFQRSGLVSENDIKRLGEMTGANYVLIAEVAYLSRSQIILTAKILNVETARVEQTASVKSSAIVDDLDENCKNLAGELLNVNVETGAVRGEIMTKLGRYVGEYKDGLPHGRGILYYSSQYGIKSYDGTWINGVMDGEGTLILNTGDKYVGKFKDGQANGYGILYYANGKLYEGDWQNNELHGKGKLTYAANDELGRKYYEGEFFSDAIQGTGKMVWNDGDWYYGQWVDGHVDGKGEYHYADGRKFVGTHKKGERCEGTFYWTDGTYETAVYSNGVENGVAIYYWDHNYRKGYYVNGKREGKWEGYDGSGRHIDTYTYENGTLVKKKFYK